MLGERVFPLFCDRSIGRQKAGTPGVLGPAVSLRCDLLYLPLDTGPSGSTETYPGQQWLSQCQRAVQVCPSVSLVTIAHWMGRAAGMTELRNCWELSLSFLTLLSITCPSLCPGGSSPPAGCTAWCAESRLDFSHSAPLGTQGPAARESQSGPDPTV